MYYIIPSEEGIDHPYRIFRAYAGIWKQTGFRDFPCQIASVTFCYKEVPLAKHIVTYLFG